MTTTTKTDLLGAGRTNTTFWHVLCVAALIAFTQIVTTARATTVTSGGFTIYDTFNFLDARQYDSAGLNGGTRISFGADLSPVGTQPPTGADGTTVTAHQGATSIQVPYLYSPALPYEFYNSIDYATHADATGAWDLEISNPSVNGGAAAHVSTSPLATTTPPPFASNVTLTGGGLTPTINWTLPGGFIPNNELVSIFDVTHKTPEGHPTLIYRDPNLPSTTTSFTVPANILQASTHYSFSVGLDQRDSQGRIQGRSRSFTPFDTLPAGYTGTVHLPAVLPDTNPNDNLGAPYVFDFGVTAGAPVSIDPQLAVGYEYMIGAGDPLFASVTLPDIGDTDGYLLCLWDGGAYDSCLTHLDPLQTYTFANGGTDRFEVLDIDPGLDPLDATAFVTALTFAGTGHFTGTMTPILTNVPEPGSIALLSLGLSMMFAGRRGRGRWAD